MKCAVSGLLERKMDQLMKRKRLLFFWLLGLLFVSYFILPVALAYFPNVMNHAMFIGGPSIAWVYTFLQIPLTWLLGWVYWHKSKQYDKYVQTILQEERL